MDIHITKNRMLKVILMLISILIFISRTFIVVDKLIYMKETPVESFDQNYIIKNAEDLVPKGDKTFQTTSIDSQIPIKKHGIDKIEIDLELLNREELKGIIYYGDYKNYIAVDLKSGVNMINLSDIGRTNRVRIDLTPEEGVQVRINKIILYNEKGIQPVDYMIMSIAILGVIGAFILLMAIILFYSYVQHIVLTYKRQLLISLIYLIAISYTMNQCLERGMMGVISILIIVGMNMIGIYMVIRLMKNGGEQCLVKIFISVSCIFGIVFIILLPPMQAPDEDVHILRSYYLSKGEIGYHSHMEGMPTSIQHYLNNIDAYGIRNHYEQKIDKKIFLENINLPLNEEVTEVNNDEGRTRTYLTYAYLPQSIGMAIGNLLELSPYWILLLGRLSNLLMWIALCALALYIMPIRKLLFFAILLIPMNIHQAASLSPDVILNASAYLLVAYTLHIKFVKERIQLKDILIILACGIGLVGVKYPYIMLMFILLVIPKERFQYKKGLSKIKSILVKFFLVIMCIAIPLFIFILNQRFLVSYDTIAVKEVASFGMLDVIKDVILNLGTYLELMISTFLHYGKSYIATLIGRFGWLDAELPNGIIIYNVLLITLLACIPQKEKYRLSKCDRGVMSFILLGFSQMLVLAMIQWNGRSWATLEVVNGIQGRYFLPFFILIPLLFSNSLIKIKHKLALPYTFSMEKIVYGSIGIIYVVAINTLIYRYWI